VGLGVGVGGGSLVQADRKALSHRITPMRTRRLKILGERRGENDSDGLFFENIITLAKHLLKNIFD
jgi:hypothetical protein